MYESFTDRIDLLSVSFNWDESPAICTWHWCRGLSPSWHIQHLKSSPYTGPSWWPPTTHPLCSHWTLGWTGPPCWDTEHTHNSMTFCRVEWLKNSFLTAAEVNYLSFCTVIQSGCTFQELVNAHSWCLVCFLDRTALHCSMTDSNPVWKENINPQL